LKCVFSTKAVIPASQQKTMSVYPTLHALRSDFENDPNKFSVGCIVQVRTPGTKRKVDTYCLVAMTEMMSCIPSLHWVYQAPPPKNRNAIDWEAYRAGRGR
jgi:hypothetical protein